MRLVLGINALAAQVDNTCIEIRLTSETNPLLIAALMLGTFDFIVRHMEGRTYGRMLELRTFEAARLLLYDPSLISASQANALLQAFEAIQDRRFQWLTDEMHILDRTAFDKAWLAVHGFETERDQRIALNEIHAAVTRISAEMDAQEQQWVHDKPAARAGHNPQDAMKGRGKKD